MKYGFIKDSIKSEDYVLGGGQVPFEVLRPFGDWTNDMPVKEFQNLNNVEPYACVIFTILNCVETLINVKYGIERNYSDRFLASVVNTRGVGCSPQRACEFLRKVGVVPQDLWKFDETIDTEDKFFEPLPAKLYELAQEFNKEWDFKHEYVPNNPEAISHALTSSPLLISVPAWYKAQNDLYYRPDGIHDNHATTLFCERPGAFRRVFDSYDHPYIKDITWDCIPEVVKRFSITRKSEYYTDYKKGNWLTQIIKSLWGFITNKK